MVDTLPTCLRLSIRIAKGFDMIARKIRSAISAGNQAITETTPKPISESVSWAFIHLDDWDVADAGLLEHQTFCQDAGYKCLVVANKFPPVLIERPDVLFEYLPLDVRSSADDGAGPDLAQAYSCKRLQHIVEFWRVVGCNWTGGRSGEMRRLVTKLSPETSVLATSAEI